MSSENRPYGAGRLYARVITVIGVLLILSAGGVIYYAFILSGQPPGCPPSGMSYSNYVLLMNVLSGWIALSLFITGVVSLAGSECLLAMFESAHNNREILKTLKASSIVIADKD